jgi:hypothetical protein
VSRRVSVLVIARASVDGRVKGNCNSGTAESEASEVNLCSTVFETGDSAVSISRQQN